MNEQKSLVRWVSAALLLLAILLQYPLWLGRGGWLRVWELDHKLGEQRQSNAGLLERNNALEAEVMDLKNGYEAIEERARNELGLVKSDEVFLQFIDTAPRQALADHR